MLLFLDIDGVLNNHSPTASGYCGIGATQAKHLNVILDELPGLHLVLSSSWRYMILGGAMSLKGFEHLLCTHGVKASNRFWGFTQADEAMESSNSDHHRRAELIRYCADRIAGCDHWLALDDDPLPLGERLIRTDPTDGLTGHEVQRVLDYFREVQS